MQLGMIGLGRMGGNMSRRLMRAGHKIVAYNRTTEPIRAIEKEGGTGAESVADLVKKLSAPRVVWVMVPESAVDETVDLLAGLLSKGDIVIDGGNSNYKDDTRRAELLGKKGINFVDVGTSGGIWGIDRGYCLMIGGRPDVVQSLNPIFEALAPGHAAAPRAEGRSGDLTAAEKGYLHCGPNGAGHFVKMVHNAIEYGIMAAYAEGFNVMKHAPGYDMQLAEIAEVWRRGSVVGSWLLDLTSRALAADPTMSGFAGKVGDSGEGRWTAHTAIDAAVPVPVLAAALFSRFSSRNEDDYANKLLSAMRAQFGGHQEPK
jgi:6-phosphogluconate dehydrogenase